MIEVRSIDDGGITEFRVVGPTTYEELSSVVEERYGTVTPAILWDLTRGSISAVDGSQMERLASLVARRRSGGWTAYVGSVDLEYGLLRMYGTISEHRGAKYESAVFRTRDEGLAWLRERTSSDASGTEGRTGSIA